MTDLLAGLGVAAKGFPRPPARPQELADHLSVSQIQDYQQCGMKYRLQRIDGEQERPAWWNVGGTAFHATIEWWEREGLLGNRTLPGSGDAQKYFTALVAAGIDVLESRSGVPRTQFRAANKGAEGEKWWREKGALMVNSYVLAHSDPGERHAYGDVAEFGSFPIPALELPYVIDCAGLELQGYIDQVRYVGDINCHVVRDLKAGRNAPSNTFQLGMYAHALRLQYGVTGPILGEYWMARKGEATRPVDLLKLWPWGAIVYQAHQAERGRRAGLFPAVPSSFCGSCGVREACPTQTGDWPVTIIPSPFGRAS